VSNAADSIKLTWLENGVAVVALEERESRNLFSEKFGHGIGQAFAAIAANPEARAVVVHGYDTYFSSGGTAGQLVDILEGRMLYTDFLFFDQLRRCEVPTIAAMQGHAIGGGMAFGMNADFVVLAEESIYCANFMEYGFTPGMASTFTLPRKLGETLGWEMLFTAGRYRGSELRERWPALQVRKRVEVVPFAIEQARSFANKPVRALKELKRRWLETTQADFDLAVQREVAMHKITFALPEVQARIHQRQS